MRIAVLSDTHANFASLKAVLADLKTQDVDSVWCLGDIVGRGFNPVDVAAQMHRLMKKQPTDNEIPRVWLAGNHDYMVLQRIETSFISNSLPLNGNNAFAARMADVNRQNLQPRPDLLDWLASLPTYAQPFAGVYVAHAAYRLDDQGDVDDIRSYSEYLMEASAISRQITNLHQQAIPAPRLIMTGHTHISTLWAWQRDGGTPRKVEEHTTKPHSFDLRTTTVYANPGSVGFPRKTDKCPTYLILETPDEFETLHIRFRQVRYDGAAVKFPKDYPEVYRKEIRRCTLK